MEQSVKKKYTRRLLNDELLRNMDEIRDKIKSYEIFVDEESFKESREIEGLYEQLRELGLNLFYVGK